MGYDIDAIRREVRKGERSKRIRAMCDKLTTDQLADRIAMIRRQKRQAELDSPPTEEELTIILARRRLGI